MPSVAASHRPPRCRCHWMSYAHSGSMTTVCLGGRSRPWRGAALAPAPSGGLVGGRGRGCRGGAAAASRAAQSDCCGGYGLVARCAGVGRVGACGCRSRGDGGWGRRRRNRGVQKPWDRMAAVRAQDHVVEDRALCRMLRGRKHLARRSGRATLCILKNVCKLWCIEELIAREDGTLGAVDRDG